MATYPFRRRTYKDLVQDLGQREAITGRTTPATQVGAMRYADLASERETDIALGRLQPQIDAENRRIALAERGFGLQQKELAAKEKSDKSKAWMQLAYGGAKIFGEMGGFGWAGQKLGLTSQSAIAPEKTTTGKVDWSMGQSYGDPDSGESQPALSSDKSVVTGGATNQQPLGGYQEVGYSSRLSTGAGTPTTALPSAGYSAGFSNTPALTSQYANVSSSGVPASGSVAPVSGSTQLTTPALGATTAPAEVGSSAKLATSTTAAKSGGATAGNYVAGAGVLYGWYDTGRASQIEGGMNDTRRITSIASGVVGGFMAAGPVGALVGGIGALAASYWGNMFGKG